MIEHDQQVGSLLKKLDELGVADNTIVIYTTDNGNELLVWPDGGYAPYRGEKGTTWEGGVRVPMLPQVAWQGEAGQRVQRYSGPRGSLCDPCRRGRHAESQAGIT